MQRDKNRVIRSLDRADAMNVLSHIPGRVFDAQLSIGQSRQSAHRLVNDGHEFPNRLVCTTMPIQQLDSAFRPRRLIGSAVDAFGNRQLQLR